MKHLSFFLFSIILISNTPKAQNTESRPFVLGVIDEIQSVQLAEKRILNIYLPDGYQQNDSIKYPVIYLLDGSADEDFIHVAGLVQYFNFPWINTVPKSIVVGIANVDRKRDFSFPTLIKEDKIKYPTTGSSGKFIAFIEKEVQPFIEKKYKANDSRTIIGQSLGGLLATEILFTKPALFDTYIIISPSLWWNDGSLLSIQPKILQPGFNQKVSIYIGVGKEGPALNTGKHIMEEDAKKLADKIKQANNKNLKVFFDYLPKEDHATVSHPAVFNAFRLLYPANKK
ncbi:MAG: alpha/beta hydrolase-fold protein [Ferruginibacter sp.]